MLRRTEGDSGAGFSVLVLRPRPGATYQIGTRAAESGGLPLAGISFPQKHLLEVTQNRVSPCLGEYGLKR